ncbi:MAG: hypothetical protein M3P08_13340 [Thermoproteota archaeon]|nr:hypothetical protein [Thermoproteota archaeon]
MASTTTTTKKVMKDTVKVTFNNKEVGFVMVDFIQWHVGNICEEYDEECSKCHRDLAQIDSYDFEHRLIADVKEYTDWKGVTEIYFTTDSTWLYYGGKDVDGNILITRMIPIHNIDNIHIDPTEPKFSESKINHLDTAEKKSLK